jgi:hypothetical protein
MGMALAAYAGTMAAALTVLMVLWNSIIGPPALDKVREQPHAVVHVVAPDAPVTAEAATPSQPGRWGPAVIHKPPEGVDVARIEDQQIAAAKHAAAAKARHLKLARQQKRREEVLARQREQQEYSTALGYGQEDRAPYGQAFGPFAQGRF